MHTGPFMTRKLALPSACLFAFACGLVAQTSAAHAQGTAGTSGTTTNPAAGVFMGTITILLTSIGDSKYVDTTTYQTPINRAQCDSDEPLHFALTNIPSTHKYLEVWVGNNCSSGDRSTRIPDTGNCIRLTSLPLTTGETTALTDVKVPPGMACDEEMQGERWIWFLAVDSEMSQVNAPDYGAIKLIFDLQPPDAPAGVKAENGETALKVSWDAASGDPWYYHIIVDPNATAGSEEDGGTGDCSSALMSAGDPLDPDALPEGLQQIYINERSTTETVDGRNYPGTTLIAWGIIADDRGHNHSELSQIVCSHIVKTKGFWETYKENGGTAEPGCNCSVPGTRNGGVATGLALGALGLIAWSRRVRRRR